MRGGDALLARIEAHLALGIEDASAEHLARGAELEARLEEHLARREQALVADVGGCETWRFATARDRLRHERAFAEISRAHVAQAHALVRYFAGEGPAHRRALARIADELPRDDAPACRLRPSRLPPRLRRRPPAAPSCSA